uniref:G-protein coupled receptors family 1 profile domain-containing protein n=1 Tax=Periophthalmus magnuspinnatus TaxID=409849 RepID=A0A3B3ZT35_9GOBI
EDVTVGFNSIYFCTLHNISCRKPQRLQDAMLFYNLLCLISLLTVTMNLLVIISIAHFRQLHSPTNLLILSLAVSDLLVGLLLIPAEILITDSCWFLGNTLCILFYMIDLTIILSSIGNIVLISIDRYLAICDPLHYNTKVTVNRVRFCVSILNNFGPATAKERSPHCLPRDRGTSSRCCPADHRALLGW